MPQRPTQPGLNRGRVQKASRRAFIGRAIVTTADVARAAYARKLLLGKQRLAPHDYKAVRRALARIADPVRRVPPYGAWLWRLKETASSDDGSDS